MTFKEAQRKSEATSTLENNDIITRKHTESMTYMQNAAFPSHINAQALRSQLRLQLKLDAPS